MNTVHSEAQLAPLDDRELRWLRARRPMLALLLIIAVDAMMISGAVVLMFNEPDLRTTFWVVIAMLPVGLVLALMTLSAEAEWRLLRKDLATGVKAYRNGRIGSLSKRDDGESPPNYRLSFEFGDPDSSIGFSIPEELYDVLSEHQTARIAYAPLSRILLELRTASCVHLAAR
jgi:hypothetical protein